MANEFNESQGAVVAIPFTTTNITTGDSDKDCLVAGGTGTLFVAPKAGSVIGIAIRASGAITAGTITARAHKAGTEIADKSYPAPAVSSAAQVSYATVRGKALTFAAGDTLGVSVTATTTLNPTNTEDIDAWLFVVLEP